MFSRPTAFICTNFHAKIINIEHFMAKNVIFIKWAIFINFTKIWLFFKKSWKLLNFNANFKAFRSILSKTFRGYKMFSRPSAFICTNFCVKIINIGHFTAIFVASIKSKKIPWFGHDGRIFAHIFQYMENIIISC